LYYIATKGCTTTYHNPHLSGEVVVDASSSQEGSKKELFVQHSHDGKTALSTLGSEGSWMSVDLGIGRLLVVDHYALRHGHGDGYGLMRSWHLQGKNEGGNWETLKVHEADQSLPKHQFGVAHWEVEAATGYRHFRILQTGTTLRNLAPRLGVPGLAAF
jgi:hypothetical protein